MSEESGIGVGAGVEDVATGMTNNARITAESIYLFTTYVLLVRPMKLSCKQSVVREAVAAEVAHPRIHPTSFY
jgi:precorrin-3B methylase